MLDEAALTGEPLPVHRHAGDQVSSGVVNAGNPFDLRATTRAADSAYAGIVRLVREAQAASAPFVRLANRYAALFLPVTLVIAGLAWAVWGTRCGRSRCWSSLRRARCCSPHRWRSCPGCPGPPAAASS